MNAVPWQRILTRRAIILELTMVAAACIPLAARQIVRDAALTLLLPVTLMGVLVAWVIVPLKSNDRAKSILIALGGPLILFVHVGNLGGTLLVAARETTRMLPHALAGLRDRTTTIDPSAWLAALSALSLQISVLGARIGTWISYIVQGSPLEDPVARAFVWSAGLWWLAAWAGWQVARNRRSLLGMLPSTVLLGLLADSYSRQMPLLWIHLSTCLLLLGIVYFESRFRPWHEAGRDYVEISTWYSLVSCTILATLLTGAAYFSSTSVIKDYLDRLREERRLASSQTGSANTPTWQGQRWNPASGIGELLGSHQITGRPELSQDIVMVISTGELPKMPRYVNPAPTAYRWRTATYETYSGRGWSNTDPTITDIPAGQALLENASDRYHLVHQQVNFPAGSTGRLYWTNILVRVDVPIQAAWRRGTTLSTTTDPLRDAGPITAFSTVGSYLADSLRLNVKEVELRAASAAYPKWISPRYLALPASVPERVLALARRLTATAATPYDRALAIESYLRRFPYTLDVPSPPSGRDAVDYFLFDLKKGYCDYYATAMVVLSRAAGLPARFVTGFASGSYDPESASYVITEANAHSWAEIYFPGSGWVEFEPTASQPLPYRQSQGQMVSPQPSAAQPGQSLIGRLVGVAARLKNTFWLAIGLMLILPFVWAPAGDWLIARRRPEEALPHFYKSVRKTALRLTGPLSPSQTAHEYAEILSRRLETFSTQKELARLVLAARSELKSLTCLYTDSLFTLRPPSRMQVLQAARTASCLRYRLLLLDLIDSFRRKVP